MAKQTVSEEEIQLRKRARRRLVGAVALAVLAAVILPMVFDDKVKPVGNVQIQIPDEKTAPPFVPAPASAPQASPGHVQASAPMAPTSVSPASAASPGLDAKAKPVEKDPHAKEIQSVKKTEKQAGYVVQLGVFSNRENARDLRKKLESAGIKTYVEGMGGKTRVRAGPYPSRAAAEVVRKRIAKSGVVGVVKAL